MFCLKQYSNCAFDSWCRHRETEKLHRFTLVPYPREFNQSLLDFFSLVDSQLILVLMCESPDLIITGLHCWAVKLKAVIKRSKVESLLPCSLSVLHA